MDELQRAQLKVQALLERVRDLTVQYENQNADLRVELTAEQATRVQAEERLKEVLEQDDLDVESDELPLAEEDK